MNMKKILPVALLFAIVLTAVSCGGKSGGDNTTKPATDVTVTDSSPDTDVSDSEEATGTGAETTAPAGDSPAVDTVPFETYVGWWTRPQSYYSEGRSYFDTFRVNADGTYTKINKYGAEVYTKPCRVEGTTIVFEADGALLTYYFDGTRLNGADGKVEFVAGSEVAPFDMNSVFGKWYRFGDRSGDSYTLSADGYTFTHEGKTIEGTWSITEGIVTHKDGTVEDDMIFNFNDDVDGNGQREFYSLTENGKVLYDSKYGNAYIHESVLATDEGRELARLFTLVCYTWEGENYDLSFDYYDSTFTLTEYVKEEDGVKEKTAVAGRWSLDGAELMFEFESPELSDEITPFEGDAFYVATYKETFERSRF